MAENSVCVFGGGGGGGARAPRNYSKRAEFTVVFSAQITIDKIKPSKV